MKILSIIMLVAAGIYFGGYWHQAEAVFKKYEQAKVAEEQKEFLKIRDDNFEMSYAQSASCMALQKSALTELRCKNEKDQARVVFNERFAARVASGWNPKTK